MFHVPGDDNYLADLLTRWGAQSVSANSVQRLHLHKPMERSILDVRALFPPTPRLLPPTPALQLRQLSRIDMLASQLPWFTQDRVSPLNPWYRGNWSPPTLSELVKHQQDIFNDSTMTKHTLRKNAGGSVVVDFDFACRLVIANHLQLGHCGSEAREQKEVANYNVLFDYMEDLLPVDISDLVTALRRTLSACAACSPQTIQFY